MKKIDLHFQLTFEQFMLFVLLLCLTSCEQASSFRHTIVDPAYISHEDIVTARKIPERHKAFIARFLPEIQIANNNILMQRNAILDLRDTIEESGAKSIDLINKLNKFLRKYRLDQINTEPMPNESDITQLLSELLYRADIIPVKLIMAQAIIESGWGTSNFALEGNNYFGIHCYKEGCGMVPDGVDSATFYVKAYKTELAGIEDYLRVLNTGEAYEELRKKRAKYRKEDIPPDPLHLAEGLTKYSERRQEYIRLVSNIIRNYIPENADELLAGKTKNAEQANL